MLTPTLLLGKFREIMSSPIDIDTCSSGECVSMLHCSDWVKIIVIRYQDLETCSLEVEVSLPTCIIEPLPSSSRNIQAEATEFIESTIDHLNYLLKLQEFGFTLGIISAEGIWSAVFEIQCIEDEKIFERLLPPSCL